MTPTEMFKLLKEQDTKKTVGFDLIPPKLVKIDTSMFYLTHYLRPLTAASCKVFSHMMLKLLIFSV